MENRVLVTGGDGFLGSNIVRELLSREYTVRVMVESNRDSPTLVGLPVERISGDIRVLQDVEAAVAGCGFLIHAAASTSIWPVKSRLLEEINVEGTRNVVRAALSNGIKKMVYVGSANSFGFGSKSQPGDEHKPYQSAQYGLGYMDTKYEAHCLVLDSIRQEGLPAAIIAPTFMFGPFDSKPGSGRVILAVAAGQVPGFSTGGRCYIHVKDVACGASSALVHGVVGESYILGNENLTYKEIFEKIAVVAGVQAPRIFFPSAISKTVGFLASLYGNLFKVEPKISLQMAKIASHEHYYSSAKAVRELSLPQTPIKTAIEDALRWFYDNGYINGQSK